MMMCDTYSPLSPDMGLKASKSEKSYGFRPFEFRLCVDDDVSNGPVPKPRSGHRVVCDSANLYSFGGYNPYISDSDEDLKDDPAWQDCKPLFQELWRFNFATCKWRKLPCHSSMPRELASNAVILDGGILLVYGGTGVPFGFKCSNSLYLCDIIRGTEMKPITPVKGQEPSSQYGQALVLHGQWLYTMGGTTGFVYNSDVHRFNLRTSVWEEVYICKGLSRHEPEGRYRHELAFDGQKIYVLGGGTATDSFGFQDIPALNLETNSWETIRTKPDERLSDFGFPAPRRCHGCVQLPPEFNTKKGSVIISGGYNGSTMYGDVWRLDLNDMQWHFMTRCVLPRPVYFHSAAVTPAGRMFTFGGILENGIRTNEVCAAWVRIPKLSEISWEAVLYYSPRIASEPRHKLINMGFPKEFVDRLDY
ncbi:kelch domain-containing protein 10 [Thrips palmi]|uniref:Kelch domain-containing protein 10 n=1 Tax=Thrips palmi TaxID=161013 RepID=A0A6P8Y6I5_THRPL|nr:kelch domain-containing protein 10 [Thrips palmi]